MMLGRTLFSVAHRLRGSKAPEVLKQIQQEPLLSSREVRERQWARLLAVVKHAAENVPYYRRIFAELGISADDIRTPEDFAALPILTKDIIRKHKEELIADGTDRSSLETHRSGGSTGVPLEFHHDAAAVDASDAGTYRNFMQCGWRPGGMIAFFWGFTPRVRSMNPVEFELRQQLRRWYQFDSFRQDDSDFRQWAKRLNRLRPAVVYGYASSIALFAEWAKRTGVSLHSPKGVFCTAEKLVSSQRDAISVAFNSRVYDVYGSSEIRNIACECPTGTFHLNADFVYAETLAAGGGASPLIFTSLRDFAFPFIRYRNEDEGSLDEIPCTCGSGFPAVSLSVSRETDTFVLPSGRSVHGLFFIHRFYGVEGVRQFQFEQVLPHLIELRVVANDSDLVRNSLLRIKSEVEELLPGQLQLNVSFVEEIPLSSSGKHRFVISRVDRNRDGKSSPDPLEQ